MKIEARFHVELVYELAFGTQTFYIAPYGKINHGVVNLSYNCGVKLGLTAICKTVTHTPLIEIIA